MTAATAAAPRVPPKKISVVHRDGTWRPIRLRWLQQIAWSALAANVGALIISALYYVFVQLRWHVGGYQVMYLKPDWDHLFSYAGWTADRHDIRNVYEALLATLFVKSLLANWRKSRWHAPDWYVAVSPLLIIIVAAPIVIGGVYLINHLGPQLWHDWFSHHHVANPVHLTGPFAFLGTYLSGWPWQPLVIGILAGLAVHRVYAPAGNRVQLYFTGRAVDAYRDTAEEGDENADRKLPQFPLPPVIRERAAWIVDQELPVEDRSRSITWAVWVMTVLGLGLAGYGGWVRYVIAKGH